MNRISSSALLLLAMLLLSLSPMSAGKANSLMIISPYYSDGTWVFDDPSVGLSKEPFVMGVPEMIDTLLEGIPDPKRGFRLLFSAKPFPGYQTKVIWTREDSGGNWYRFEESGMEGWLCPALFKYFEEAPKEIYAQALPRKE